MMSTKNEAITAAVAAFEAAREAATLADREVERINDALGKLRADLELREDEAAAVADVVGEGMVAAMLDGTKPTTKGEGSMLAAAVECQRLRAAVAACERRHADATAAATAAHRAVHDALDAVSTAEARAAADALLRVWPQYRDAWTAYAAACSAAGMYVSPHSETVESNGHRITVQPVGIVERTDIEVAYDKLAGPTLRTSISG